jgi:hypothetical protein
MTAATMRMVPMMRVMPTEWTHEQVVWKNQSCDHLEEAVGKKEIEVLGK